MENSKGYFSLINEHYSHLLSKEIILAYDGDDTHQVKKAFAQLVEGKMESENEDITIRRHLHHVLVECLQNINRHAEVFSPDTSDYNPGRGALLVSKSDNHYRVITANLISEANAETMKNYLEEINRLSIEELNEKYKQQLKEGRLSSKGGAGLGYIDIRRKVENKLEFHFIKNNDNNSFFLLNVIISRK